MSQVVLGSPGDKQKASAPDQDTAWAMVFMLGLALTIVGGTDVGLLFVPSAWASLDWEFGTVSGFIDGLPLATMGFGAMVVAASARGWRKWRAFLGTIALLMALVVLAMLLIYALDLPAAYRAIAPTARPTLTKAAFKTTMMGSVYFVSYAALGVWTWRRLRSLKGAMS